MKRAKSRSLPAHTAEDGAVSVYIDSTRIERAFADRQAAFQTTLFDLVLHGGEGGPEKIRVVPRNYAWTPLSHFRCLSCNWLRYTPTFGARLKVPVRFVDAEKCAPLKLGAAHLEVVTGLVSFHCKGPRIPSYLQVSLAGKEMNDHVRLSEINLPGGASLLHKVPDRDNGDLLLAKIASK